MEQDEFGTDIGFESIKILAKVSFLYILSSSSLWILDRDYSSVSTMIAR